MKRKKTYVLAFYRPIKISVYSSIQALIEDNINDSNNKLGVSKWTIRKHNFNNEDFHHFNFIIAQRNRLTTGDVRSTNS